MTFDQFPYEKVEPDEVKAKFREALESFENATSAEEQRSIIGQINEIRDHVMTMASLARIKHSQDTTDARWEEEQNYYDRVLPELKTFRIQYYKKLTESPFRSDLSKDLGEHLFEIARVNSRTLSADVVEDLKKENQLTSKYQKKIASASIPFRGEKRTLSGLEPFIEDTDRSTRREALQARWKFYEKNSDELDQLYDKLVSIRHRIAQNLGYDNFVQLGYDRMKRTDYGPEDVASLRSIIRQKIVPLVGELKKRQQSRLDVDELTFYDEPLQFPDGNPEPDGPPSWILNRAEEMYDELSPETSSFFAYMRENELMDLVDREGKAEGGYCTYLPNQNAPFIFSNFNGTKGDINVLTHEVGHAFQCFCTRTLDLPEYRSPTAETAEIHSFGMEFMTRPWMELFFGDETEKFLADHLASAISFLPYGAAVDEFQHRIYEQPDLTPRERNQIWEDVEQRYLPHRNYDDLPYLDNGTYWQQQRHIYQFPFYYIDYVLARICALQIWNIARNNRDRAWDSYVGLCESGGKKPFRSLIEEQGLTSPFDESWTEDLLPEIREDLQERFRNTSR